MWLSDKSIEDRLTLAPFVHGCTCYHPKPIACPESYKCPACHTTAIRNPYRLEITPYAEGGKREGRISYGLSSAGYDMRLAQKFLLFTNAFPMMMDPKEIDKLIKERVAHGYNQRIEADHLVLPPNSFALAESVETFCIPEDIICIVLGKSTYARTGICLNMTPLEPGWRGIVTIEIANLTPLPAKVYANEGIGQVLFGQIDKVPRHTYNRKPQQKYQDQTGLTPSRV